MIRLYAALLIIPLTLSACGDDGPGTIDAATGDTGVVDSGMLDSAVDSAMADSSVADSGTTDGSVDASPDATVDGSVDAAMDATTDSGAPMDGAMDGSADAAMDAAGPTACIDFMVTTVGAAVLTGSTVGAGNDFGSPVCDGIGPDVTVLFTAPAASSYVFDTAGSDFDTTLSLHTPDCGAPMELACSDDASDASFDSVVSITLEAGAEVLLNVDGLGADDEGDFVLNVTAVADTCPDVDLGTATGATVVTAAELTGATPDNRTGSCSYGGAGHDLAYRWTASGAGTYRFATTTSVDTVLYLLDGDCAGAELACNDDGPSGAASALSATLTAGQTVIVVVEGFAETDLGAFDLSIMGPT